MDVQCAVRSDGTSFGLIAGYGGIPENLVINSIYFGAVIIAFLFVRRYIRDQDRENQKYSLYHLLTHPGTVSELNIKNLNPLTIVWKTITLSLNEIGHKCGPDSTKYLYLQMHLAFYSMVLCVVSMFIVLPVYFQGNLDGNRSNFGFSTLSNLPHSSNLLWLPIFVNLFTTIVGILVMFHYLYAGHITRVDRHSQTTLMVRHIQPEHCNAEDFCRILRAVLPDEKIEDITVAYDVWRLNRTIQNSAKIRTIVEACNELKEEQGTAGRVYHCVGGYYFSKITCQRCRKIRKSDAMLYYKRKMDEADKVIDNLAKESLNHPTGIVFITFATEESAARALGVLNQGALLVKLRRLLAGRGPFRYRRMSDTLHQGMLPNSADKWVACYAPTANNIFWENVTEKTWLWWFRLIVLNLCLIWVAILLATPSMLLNILDKIVSIVNVLHERMAIFLVNVLPPVLLKMMSKVVPPVAGYSSHLERHITRSCKGKRHVHKAFNLLLLTTLIIPSLGLTGLDGFIRWWSEVDFRKHLGFQWQCIFLPDNGAFYVNYVITSALLATGTSLLRIPELLEVGFNLLFCRSKPEERAIYKLERLPFTYASSYASVLNVFAVISAYSILCPLITVFGVLYFIIRFAVDKYTIYFVSAPSFVRQRIDLSAFRCSLTCLLMPQLFLAIFMALKAVTIRDPHFITQAVITASFTFLYLLERQMGDQFVSKAVGPFLDVVPVINTRFTDEKEISFKRYYPNYMLPYVGECTLAQAEREKQDAGSMQPPQELAL